MQQLPPISSASTCRMRQFAAQITRMDVIFTEYYMASQVMTISCSLMYKNKLITGYLTLGIILVVPCGIFCRIYLKSISVIALLGIFRGRVDGCGDVL